MTHPTHRSRQRIQSRRRRSPGIGSSRDLVALTRAHLAAVNARDLDRLVAFYTDDAVLEFPASPRVEGKPSIRRAFQLFFEQWNELSTYRAVVAAGTTIAIEGTTTGAHQTLHLRIPGRVPAGGARTYRHDFAMFLEFKAGKIRRQRVYFDARELVQQLLR